MFSIKQLSIWRKFNKYFPRCNEWAYQDISINSPDASDKLAVAGVAMVRVGWRRCWSNATNNCLQVQRAYKMSLAALSKPESTKLNSREYKNSATLNYLRQLNSRNSFLNLEKSISTANYYISGSWFDHCLAIIKIMRCLNRAKIISRFELSGGIICVKLHNDHRKHTQKVN